MPHDRHNVRMILLSGKMGVGKTATATALEPYMFKRVSLATALKRDAEEILGRKLDKSIDRQFLIDYGQKMRKKNINHWCRELEKSIHHMQRHTDRGFVIDDLRFKNEVRYFRQKFANLNPVVVRLDISDDERARRLFNLYGTDMREHWNDISETDLDGYRKFDMNMRATGFGQSLGTPERIAYDLMRAIIVGDCAPTVETRKTQKRKFRLAKS